MTPPTKESRSRWKDFTDQELRIIAYGLAQIHGDPSIEKMLDEINPIVFPLARGKHKDG